MIDGVHAWVVEAQESEQNGLHLHKRQRRSTKMYKNNKTIIDSILLINYNLS